MRSSRIAQLRKVNTWEVEECLEEIERHERWRRLRVAVIERLASLLASARTDCNDAVSLMVDVTTERDELAKRVQQLELQNAALKAEMTRLVGVP